MMKTFHRIGFAVACAALLVFASSIVGSLVSGPDERCDFCGRMMQYDYAQPGVNAVLVIYRCPDRECDQRGQREYRNEGTINWTEW